ncbi:MAG: sigma-70 family RNA polymerase sigma factor [Lachnospiraceae bacterium]|nr:sigma-70 family RNA polymerase sigma factor [Lachnospiraceae bacterium]
MENKAEFIEKNLGLVRFVSKRFQNRGLDMEDIFQAGCVGLCKAAEGFQEELGFKFSTYAVPLIIGEIHQLVRNNSPVHISRNAREKQKCLQEAGQELTQALGREVRLSEMADAAGISTREALLLMEAAGPAESLEKTATEEGDEKIQRLTDGRDEVGGLLDRMLCRQLLMELSSVERILITMRYFQGKNQTQVGEKLHMSQVQVSRMEKKILRRLREKVL